MSGYIRKVFLMSILFALASSAFATTEIVKTLSDQSDSKTSPDAHKVEKKLDNRTLLEQFKDNYARLYYFAQELTNNIDHLHKIESYDFVIPGVSQGVQEFSTTIMPGLFLLENVEKTMKERNAIQDIKTFLNTNYKTSYLPARVYRESDHIERPLYMSQLRELAFNAVAKGDLYALRALLDNYKLIDVKSDDDYGLLSYALLHNQTEAAELLIKRGCDINNINKYGGSPMTIAARLGNLKILKLLTEQKGCNIFHRDRFDNSAVDYAYLTNNRPMQNYLRQFYTKR